MRLAAFLASLLISMAVQPPLVAFAQTPPQPTSPSAQATPKPSTQPSTTPKPPASTSLVGTWSGRVQQIGRRDPFSITLTIDAKGAGTTAYPDQSCSGKLTRIGTSGSYVFYAEKITKGAYDEARATGCLDGTIVLIKAGNALLMSWFGMSDNQPYQASATLAQSNAPKL